MRSARAAATLPTPTRTLTGSRVTTPLHSPPPSAHLHLPFLAMVRVLLTVLALLALTTVQGQHCHSHHAPSTHRPPPLPHLPSLALLSPLPRSPCVSVRLRLPRLRERSPVQAAHLRPERAHRDARALLPRSAERDREDQPPVLRLRQRLLPRHPPPRHPLPAVDQRRAARADGWAQLPVPQRGCGVQLVHVVPFAHQLRGDVR